MEIPPLIPPELNKIPKRDISIPAHPGLAEITPPLDLTRLGSREIFRMVLRGGGYFQLE